MKIPFAETAFFRLQAGFDKLPEKGDRDDWEDFVPGSFPSPPFLVADRGC